MSLPRIIHQLEGALVAAGCLFAYTRMDADLRLFALLFLAPDLGMLGYLANPRLGAATYNALHTYLLPVALGVAGVIAGLGTVPIALIWAAHIGLDRALGFGLKYPDGFQSTDLRRLSSS
jgi:hypothetical protein